jgi:hypothetical protein
MVRTKLPVTLRRAVPGAIGYVADRLAERALRALLWTPGRPRGAIVALLDEGGIEVALSAA